MLKIKSVEMKYLGLLFVGALLSCTGVSSKNAIAKENTKEFTDQITDKKEDVDKSNLVKGDLKEAYFASGCFWCVEAIFQSVKGVDDAISGYAGGTKATANYSDVSSGATKHAEFVKVIYDPAIVSYETLLTVFFDSHDYWTLNRQGPDAGTQYRSAIYYETESEKEAIEAYIKKLESSAKPNVTTEVKEFTAFYKAEDYHQEYEHNHPDNSYVRAVSVPRLNKFKAKHPELLK